MYDTILVPLDGSRRAESILCHVENMAYCYGAEVVFLGVIEPEPVVVGPGTVYPTLDQHMHEQRTCDMERYLQQQAGQFREKQIRARAIVSHGPVVEQISHVADREGAELIAMASHGRTGLSRVFFGSVAAGVLHRVDRPILLIRAPGF